MVLGSSPGENGFYSSETNDDRRTERRPKLFVPAKNKKIRKTVLYSNPGEDVFCTLEINDAGDRQRKPVLFASARRLQGANTSVSRRFIYFLSWQRLKLVISYQFSMVLIMCFSFSVIPNWTFCPNS
jgi:hypothetical protein